jgi:hypothetical protein
MAFSTTNCTSCFIDLATFTELEGFLYGGPEAITWFVASVQKANWFSFVPIMLRQEGSINFGGRNSSATLNRSGDYVLNIWFRCQIPQIQLNQPYVPGVNVGIFRDASIRWTRYLMHNIFDDLSITFNELTVAEFDSYWFDCNFQFRVRGSKRSGYRNIVGDISAMTTPVGVGVPLGTGGYFSAIMPFWFGEDSGIALPVAALPFNEIKTNYTFRQWQQLVVIYPGTSAVGGPGGTGTGVAATTSNVSIVGQPTAPPAMQDAQTWAHYAVIHNDERVKMGDAPRDVLINQIQEVAPAPFTDVNAVNQFDIRLSYAIMSLFWMAQNYSLLNLTTNGGGEWSNYTTEPDYAGLDPISFSTLLYENTVRLATQADYYALLVPFFWSDAIPDDTGYHMWSYGLVPWDPTKPSGSTNYSKLANVSWNHNMSTAAQNAALGIDQFGNTIVWPNTSGTLVTFPQVFQAIHIARNHNIIRVANGSLGQPVL